MANNYDLSKLAVKMVCPTNDLIVDDKDLPGVYVQRASMKLSELLNTSDESVHPAFMVDGKAVSKIAIGKYQGKAYGNRLYSLPGEDPTANATYDTFVSYCRNKGAGHHEITAAEWAFLALLAKKNGTMPKGNNGHGKDHSETVRIAIPTYKDASKTYRVATGTGPLTWSDDGTREGIFDLNGNVWEWVTGLRLVKGELQVIPYNDAALPTTDISASSDAWRAVNAEATGWDNLFIVPNGTGTTTNSVKLDYVSSHWQWQKSTISPQTDSSRSATFGATTIAADVSAFVALYLRAMALAPDDGTAAADYNGDYFWANNAAADALPFRGGDWGNGAHAGVFGLDLGRPRSGSYSYVGGRSAFVDL